MRQRFQGSSNSPASATCAYVLVRCAVRGLKAFCRWTKRNFSLCFQWGLSCLLDKLPHCIGWKLAQPYGLPLLPCMPAPCATAPSFRLGSRTHGRPQGADLEFARQSTRSTAKSGHKIAMQWPQAAVPRQVASGPRRHSLVCISAQDGSELRRGLLPRHKDHSGDAPDARTAARVSYN